MCGDHCKHNDAKLSRAAKKEIKANAERVDKACQMACNGLRVNIFDLSKLAKHGETLRAQGYTDDEMAQGVHNYAVTLPGTSKA